jgi:hypothetical protein
MSMYFSILVLGFGLCLLLSMCLFVCGVFLVYIPTKRR